MDTAIAWAGFVGAWLLVAGSLFQAAMDLEDGDNARDRLDEATADVPKPDDVSAWWWLLPPVAYLLARRRAHGYREAVFARLDPGDLEAMMSYLNKAEGWLLVGLGALLLASKETWELREHHEWTAAVFWILVVVMAGLSVGHAAARLGRARQLVAAGPGAAR